MLYHSECKGEGRNNMNKDNKKMVSIIKLITMNKEIAFLKVHTVDN